MTTTETYEIPVRLDFDNVAKTFSQAMARLDRAATEELDRVDFPVGLRELLRLRASQLNGCAYCVDLHSRDARAAGESEQRIYSLPVWRETPFFSARERAALEFAEAVTLVAADHVPDPAFADVAEHYKGDEIGALVGLLVTINAWNRIGVSTRAWLPGSYVGASP
jgi:AhpD family alkylhydroperoxidase